MTEDDRPRTNEELVRDGAVRTSNQGDFEAGEEFVADHVDYDGQGELRGYEALDADSEIWREVFPDAEAANEEGITDGAWSTFRYPVRGTQENSFEGIPPTGRSVEAKGTRPAKIVDGDIVDNHLVFDGLGLIQQLGVMEGWEGKQ